MSFTKEENIIIFFACVILFVVLLCAFIVSLVYRYQKNRMEYFKEIEKIKSDYAHTLMESQLEIQEQTFLHISREIHDNIGQKLTLAKLYLNTMPVQFAEMSNNRIGDCLTLISDSISSLSDLSRGMSTDFVISNGLVKAIENEVKILNKTGVYNAQFTIKGDEVFLEGNTELVIFRIVQECINNFVKHSQGSTLVIDLIYSNNELNLHIQDDGIGLAVSDTNGSGLINMRKRTELLKGAFNAGSNNRGAFIEVIIPI